MLRKYKYILGLALFSLLNSPANAHDEDKPIISSSSNSGFVIGRSPNHPERKWKILETEHFLIHYYDGFELLSKETANLAEEAYFKVTKDLKASPNGKVPIILTQDEFLNGYAEPIKNRIVLDPVLMRSSIIGARRFITHEFTHIITYESFSSGVNISKLYGLGNAPTWFLEGVAQYEAEYWYPAYDRMLRLHTLERSILSPTERDAFTILGADEGAAGYNEGYAIVKYIFDTYGHDKLAKVLEEIKANNVPLVLAMERVIGKSLLILETEWREQLEERYREQIKGKDQTVKDFEVIVKKEQNEANIRPKVSPDGKVFTYMTSQGRAGYVNIRGKIIGLMPIRARLLGQDEKEENKIAGQRQDKGVFTEKDSKGTLLAGGVLDYAWSPDSALLAYTKIGGDDVGQPDINLGFTHIKKEGDKLKVKDHYTHNYRIYSSEDKEFKNPLKLIDYPTFSPNDKKLAFVASYGETSNIYMIDLKDLDKKIDKVIAKQITNTKLYLYKDLSWSPDGKYIATSIYKSGNGGNLALLDVNDNSVKYFTNDDVIYTNSDPTWSKDSKKIYYSSDRSDISNLYSYNLESNLTERLSDSYAGLDFPYVRNDYIYYSSYFAKGTDIKRTKLDKLKTYQTNETKLKIFAEKPFIENNKVKYHVKNYTPWLSPDLILPMTGFDERGDQIGVRGSLDDILQQHSVNAALAYGLLSGKFSYGVSYVNRMFDPLLAVQISEFPGIAATQDGKSYYFQRVQGFDFIVSRPFFNELSQQISNVGNLELSFNNLNPIQDTISKDTDQKLVRFGWNNFIALGFNSQEIGGGATADIHPTNGYRFSLRIENANKLLQSKYEYTQISTDIRRYFPLWFNHVLALRGTGQFITGQNTPLLLGGPPVNLNFGIQTFVPMRGYNIAQLIGDRLGLISAEYRFPIFTRLNTIFSGVYVDSIYGALFADAGDAWFQSERNPRFNLGAGFELRARVAVGSRSTLGAFVGIGRNLTPQPNQVIDNQLYFGFANAF
ncbi:MAG: BamA/TamA family outer membrane protein [Candidatus Sericytochromatia bacterium]